MWGLYVQVLAGVLQFCSVNLVFKENPCQGK